MTREPTYNELLAKVAALRTALEKARWYVEVYDTREHNTEQDAVLTLIDALLKGEG